MSDDASQTAHVGPGRQIPLNALIGVAYDCAMEPARWADVIREMRALTDSAAGKVAIVNLLGDRGSSAEKHGESSECDQLDNEWCRCIDSFMRSP